MFGETKLREKGIKNPRKYLAKDEVYQQTARRKPEFNKIMALPRTDRPDQFQGDLLDVSKMWKQNKGTRFLMVWIDVYSRKAWVFPMKKKTSAELMRVNEPFLTEYKPKNLGFQGLRVSCFGFVYATPSLIINSSSPISRMTSPTLGSVSGRYPCG